MVRAGVAAILALAALAACATETRRTYDYAYEGERYLVEVTEMDRPAGWRDQSRVTAYEAADGERRIVSTSVWTGGTNAYVEAQALAQRPDAPLALKIYFLGERLGIAAPSRSWVVPDTGRAPGDY